MSNHDFCRLQLTLARQEAAKQNVTLPKRITALQSTKDQWFVESDSMEGVYIKADCAWDARASFINKLIDAKREPVHFRLEL